MDQEQRTYQLPALEQVSGESPTPFKVPDYEDALPVGKSLAIVGGIIVLIIGIIFLAKTSKNVDLKPPKNEVDFSKMNARQQQPQQQGQVAGVQTYGPPDPSVSPDLKTDKTPTPTPTQAPSPTPTSTPAPTPTATPQPTATPTP